MKMNFDIKVTINPKSPIQDNNGILTTFKMIDDFKSSPSNDFIFYSLDV